MSMSKLIGQINAHQASSQLFQFQHLMGQTILQQPTYFSLQLKAFFLSPLCVNQILVHRELEVVASNEAYEL